MAAPPTAVLFLTHFANAEVLRRFGLLQRALGGRHRVFYAQDLLSSVAHRRITRDLEPDLFLFDRALLKRLPYERAREPWEGASVVPGRVDLVPQLFRRLHPGFERIYLVEHDVVCGEDWRRVFDILDESPADLLATNVTRRDEHPRWNLWRELQTPGRPLPPADRQARALLAFCRYSRQALLALEAAYAEGWRGHFEALVPTVCLAAGLGVEDIGGEGPFVPPGRERRFYWSDRLVVQHQPAAGTFVYRPAQVPVAGEKWLWHPVKVSPAFDWSHRVRRWRHGHVDRAAIFAEMEKKLAEYRPNPPLPLSPAALARGLPARSSTESPLSREAGEGREGG